MISLLLFPENGKENIKKDVITYAMASFFNIISPISYRTMVE
jgi:hypothetical protein